MDGIVNWCVNWEHVRDVVVVVGTVSGLSWFAFSLAFWATRSGNDLPKHWWSWLAVAPVPVGTCLVPLYGLYKLVLYLFTC